MKIHPNHEFNKMLKDGDAIVVTSKYLPSRYMYKRKETAGNRAGAGRTGKSEARAASRTEPEAAATAGTAPQVSRAAGPMPTAWTIVQAADIFQTILPYNPSGTEQPPVTEPEVSYVPEIPPEKPHQPEAGPDGESEKAGAAPAETVPSVEVRVLQPEDGPGGLVAELQFEGDPSGLVFGASPGYVSDIPAISTGTSDTPPSQEEDPSYPPYINFACFNRLGLTVRNLTELLNSDEDFELNIIDCNSKDNSWDYIQSLNDSRIKSRIRFEKNCGPIFAANFGLSRRKPHQYFFVIDSDTFIKTKNWIARFMEVFKTFPEVGLLGLMRDRPYPRFMPPIIPRVSGDCSYLELKNADINSEMDFIPGHLQCMRPGLIREIGYWSEENGFGDAELSPRVVHYTNYKAGFITTVEIDMTQRITCEECQGKAFCKLNRSICDCFMFSRIHNKNESFVEKNTWKFKQSFQELKEGKRTAFCASIHDPESVKTHFYNAEWAYENFNHYILNAN
jgi:hypothetical protein